MRALTPEGRGQPTADERTQAPPLQLSTAGVTGRPHVPALERCHDHNSTAAIAATGANMSSSHSVSE